MAQSSAGKDGARRRACSVLTPSRARGSIDDRQLRHRSASSVALLACMDRWAGRRLAERTNSCNRGTRRSSASRRGRHPRCESVGRPRGRGRGRRRRQPGRAACMQLLKSISAAGSLSNGLDRPRGWTVFHLPSTPGTGNQIPSSWKSSIRRRAQLTGGARERRLPYCMPGDRNHTFPHSPNRHGVPVRRDGSPC